MVEVISAVIEIFLFVIIEMRRSENPATRLIGNLLTLLIIVGIVILAIVVFTFIQELTNSF